MSVQRFRKYIPIIAWLIAGFLVFSYVSTNTAFARPGGGSSYSSGGSSGGGGEGGAENGVFAIAAGLVAFGFKELRGKNVDSLAGRKKRRIGLGLFSMLMGFFGFIVLFFNIIVVIIYAIAGAGLLSRLVKKGNSAEAKGGMISSPTGQNRQKINQGRDAAIANLKQRDENFSKVLFLDFAAALFHKYYNYMGSAKVSEIKPFLSGEEFTKAQDRRFASAQVSEIVIGSISVFQVNDAPAHDGIAVDIDANYTLTVNNHSTRYVVYERWLFHRKKGILSLQPDKMRDVSCPNCGAPAHFNDAGTCEYCSTQIQSGDMQWMLKKRNILRQETFRTQELGTYAEEAGTNLPTIYQPDLKENIQAFVQQHQASEGHYQGDWWQAYWRDFAGNFASQAFNEIYKAWTAGNLSPVRHLLSDRLAETFNFWLSTYADKKMTNKLENTEILDIDLAAIDLDKFYETFTVRIFAEGMDYVVDSQGKLVGGDKRNPRRFSEYWTFIRRSGVEQTKSEWPLHNCPSCGAPADNMGQGAECGYCGSKISNGEFSWVLSVITQDEVYKG